MKARRDTLEKRKMFVRRNILRAVGELVKAGLRHIASCEECKDDRTCELMSSIAVAVEAATRIQEDFVVPELDQLSKRRDAVGNTIN